MSLGILPQGRPKTDLSELWGAHPSPFISALKKKRALTRKVFLLFPVAKGEVSVERFASNEKLAEVIVRFGILDDIDDAIQHNQ